MGRGLRRAARGFAPWPWTAAFARSAPAARAAWLLALAAACGSEPGGAASAPPPATAPAPAVAQAEPGPGSPVVLVAYYTQTGMTRKMAEAVAEGARERAGRVILAPIDSVTAEDLRSADAILLGSPTHWGNMATAMRGFIDSWTELGVSVRDRIGGAFATGGGSAGGKEMVMTSMILAMMNHGMIVVGPLFREGEFEYGNFGAAATTGLASSPSIPPADLDAARALGRRAAETAGRLRRD